MRAQKPLFSLRKNDFDDAQTGSIFASEEIPNCSQDVSNLAQNRLFSFKKWFFCMTSMLWHRSSAKRFWISSRIGKIKNPLKNNMFFDPRPPEHIPKYSHDVSNQSSEKYCFWKENEPFWLFKVTGGRLQNASKTIDFLWKRMISTEYLVFGKKASG